MKAIFAYIRSHDLYLEGDKRYIDLTKHNEYLDNYRESLKQNTQYNRESQFTIDQRWPW